MVRRAPTVYMTALPACRIHLKPLQWSQITPPPPHRGPPIRAELTNVRAAWRLPLSMTEHRDLLVALPSLPLACTFFRWIATRVFLWDAHVVSPSYATHLLSLLQRLGRDRLPTRSRSFEGRSSPVTAADALRCSCWSITFHIYDQTSTPDIPTPTPSFFNHPCTLATPHRTSLHWLVLHTRTRARTLSTSTSRMPHLVESGDSGAPAGAQHRSEARSRL